MKIILLPLLLACVVSSVAQSLTGRVLDADSQEPLPGATLYLPDLKTGATTDDQGQYRLYNLPRSQFLVQVKSLGYATKAVTIDLSKTTRFDFSLQVSALETSEIVVTGSAFTSDQSRNSVPVVPLENNSVSTAGSGNLANALTAAPGVSTISTGASIGKPVIRGLSYSRIVTVSDGIRQEGQQWGDEHGLEIDEFSADRIEVLKGPASLLYGSDALGGVIHILEPVPPPPGLIRGQLQTHYSTNNGLSANSLLLEGNHDGTVWRARGTYKNAAPFRTPAERVVNSGFREINGEAMVGLNRRWGYLHLLASQWDGRLGMTTGERDSTGALLAGDGHLPTADELTSRTPDLPYQNVVHQKISFLNNIILGKSQLRVNAGWQKNVRQEYESTNPGLWMELQTGTADVVYYFPQPDSMSGFEAVLGGHGMIQVNKNLGTDYLIPAYRLADAGGFFSVKKNLPRTTFNAGIRFDGRTLQSDALTIATELRFPALERTYTAISGSVGATWLADSTWNFRMNIGRGYRAPNLSELSSNGVHEGAFRYEVGNPDLKAETSWQTDIGISAESGQVSASLDAFFNAIQNFIVANHTPGDSIFIDGNRLPVYRFTQHNASLYGLECSIDFHPWDHLHFENSFSLVIGENNSTGRPLPYIPPAHMVNELRYTFSTRKSSRISEPSLHIALVSNWRQERIGEFETPTAGSITIQGGASCAIRVHKQSITAFVIIRNLTDKQYDNHLSRIKQFGVHEMGTNVTFGLQVPFGIKR